jgi:hypothetical protein
MSCFAVYSAESSPNTTAFIPIVSAGSWICRYKKDDIGNGNLRERWSEGRRGWQASAILPLLDDITTSPASRGVAFARPPFSLRQPGCRYQPIPKLYSARELGSFWGWTYNGGGNNAEALCTGQIAGRNAAAAKPVGKTG